ncbi:MAG TPA: type II toxin-antitoxin system VapC family toxin [Chloroflexota bacterium]|nr:type II toxin-antitoxin system VapC family toxin [Chloroflexota bacterium]
MRLLLDTHILLWCLGDDTALPSQARNLIADPANQISISSISLWEIAIKSRLGKLEGTIDDIHAAVLASGFLPLPFTLDHAAAVAQLPFHHRDPFDRALIAQAHREPLYLLTHDKALAAYGRAVIMV